MMAMTSISSDGLESRDMRARGETREPKVRTTTARAIRSGAEKQDRMGGFGDTTTRHGR